MKLLLLIRFNQTQWTNKILKWTRRWAVKGNIISTYEGLVKDLSEAIEKVDEVIVYEDCTMVDIAEQYIDEHCDLNGLSSLIVNNIDYQGIAREFVNRIQNLRKDDGLEVTDRIILRILQHDSINNSIIHIKYRWF